MLSRLLFYGILKPLSFLPFTALYVLSDVLYLILYKLAGYRQKIVRGNLVRSFPDQSEKEIKTTERLFYRHFCDLIVESIKLFSISENELNKRAKIINPEVLNTLYDEGRSVILAGGHYNNWEMGGTILGTQVKHHLVGIYAPMSNAFFNDKFLQSRGRFGLEMLSKKKVKEGFEANKNKLTATLFATDQSPTHSKTVHWTTFLNQPTAVLVGTERFAIEYNFPVVYVFVRKQKRGYYEMEARVIEAHPGETKEGEITEKHTRILEAEILAHPQYWLWTHKRWKRVFKDGDRMYQPEAG